LAVALMHCWRHAETLGQPADREVPLRERAALHGAANQPSRRGIPTEHDALASVQWLQQVNYTIKSATSLTTSTPHLNNELNYSQSKGRKSAEPARHPYRARRSGSSAVAPTGTDVYTFSL